MPKIRTCKSDRLFYTRALTLRPNYISKLKKNSILTQIIVKQYIVYLKVNDERSDEDPDRLNKVANYVHGRRSYVDVLRRVLD